MADAADSKSAVREGVWVRIPPRAHMSRAAIEKKLAQNADELRAAQEEIRVLDEQILHFADSADDARLRAMVSETPLADREHRDAARTVAALNKDRDVWSERAAKLEVRQDELLDELMEAGRS